MRRALTLAGTPGVPLGPNPRVGCVLVDRAGAVIAEGYHRGAGTPHAEVDALAAAGDRARGATAVVTLEPCDHTGRTGPCTQALTRAGVQRVVYAMADPNPVASGGRTTLQAAGIEVSGGLLEQQARELNAAWLFGLTHGRPFVTWKLAASLDGRSAAADGTSRWISGAASRRDAHRLRGRVDTILVGTETAVVDDPALTVRDDTGRPLEHQPLRAVMGERELPAGLQLLQGAKPALHLRTRDPGRALAELFDAGRRHVLLEGGPTLAAAFLRAGLVDEIVAYLAPVLLGAGRSAVADLGIGAIGNALRPEVLDATVLAADPGEQPDVRLIMRPAQPPTQPPTPRPEDPWRPSLR
ncbi:bifunctional diaminohydroxyphosphoribosylaminopyrimidine deaminase/5-amino-6-(5-phosphoribosylamino)uracil reductase RibD [Arsenicicoccus piscis]|nr:bifunctional diaminohydroxyphosphoribosylaminopyrimidine deaminase/5-amino-6-(5-phosphoribosylamino)uracil reductase RibD [Arsenicicoccus piscis]MCH8626243.1 bifunctional diaminohydroxyphosphoribosylaminopyrimidine deaminase/5-amino-6-(5-phosphoribosylamino)uracil reductase RibD [Arsenicicoccus piscis]